MWGVLNWSLLAFGWNLVSGPAWRPLGGRLFINAPSSQEFSDGPKFGIESTTSGVQVWSLTVASRLLRPHSTEDKTLR